MLGKRCILNAEIKMPPLLYPQFNRLFFKLSHTYIYAIPVAIYRICIQICSIFLSTTYSFHWWPHAKRTTLSCIYNLPSLFIYLFFSPDQIQSNVFWFFWLYPENPIRSVVCINQPCLCGSTGTTYPIPQPYNRTLKFCLFFVFFFLTFSELLMLLTFLLVVNNKHKICIFFVIIDLNLLPLHNCMIKWDKKNENHVQKIEVGTEHVPVSLKNVLHARVKSLSFVIIVAMEKFIEFNHVKFETDFFVMSSHIDRMLCL